MKQQRTQSNTETVQQRPSRSVSWPRTIYCLPQVGLDLDLSAKLVLHPGLEELLLLQDLYGHDVARPLLPCQVHRAELSPPQRTAYLEVGDGPVLALPGRCSHAAGATGAAIPIAAAAVAAPSISPGLLELDALWTSARRGVGPYALRPLGGRGVVVGIVALDVCKHVSTSCCHGDAGGQQKRRPLMEYQVVYCTSALENRGLFALGTLC